MSRTPVPSEHSLRRQIIEAGRRLFDHGLVTASDGNLSIRLGEDRILITPAGANKGRIESGDLIVIDLEGRPLPGSAGRVPSTEAPMHLEVYRSVAAAGAVVHAHPPCAVALTVAGIPFPVDVLPEIVATLGEVPVTQISMPSTPEDAEAIRPFVAAHRAILLAHHGSLTYGETLEEAVAHVERLEHAAAVYWLASCSGNVHRLPPELTARLKAWSSSSG
ncbi:MAG TPA: class II aldolase/adducin family protein [Anaerolineales bacterium]|nr:class II aldolase/adducin family protein [Anaerolineales bacterium]